eukprot:gene4250-3072_t
MADFDQDDALDDNAALSSDVIQDEVVNLVRGKLSNEEWNPAKVDGWTEEIITSIMKVLGDMKRPYKYIVTCTVMQKTGASLSTGFISLWDNAKDGMVHVPYENDTLHVLVTVYFLKID